MKVVGEQISWTRRRYDDASGGYVGRSAHR